MRGSNWIFESIDALELHTVKYKPLNGSSYIPLPKALASKKAIINMQNDDKECFKWCVTRALYPVSVHPERITKILRKQSEELNWSGIEFPLELQKIDRFERQNNLAVNVFGYERIVYPLRISDSSGPASERINLLLISSGEKQHYCPINNMSRLLSSQKSKHHGKKFWCLRCLNSFGTQMILDQHEEYCKDNEAVRINMPIEKLSILSFKNQDRKVSVPFVIYADFESFIIPIHTTQPFPKESYTNKIQAHKPSSFCYYIKCDFDDSQSKLVEYTATSEDEDVAQKFVDMLEYDTKRIYNEFGTSKKMIFGKEEKRDFERSTQCWICGGGFNEEDRKVCDHCHYTGKYRGAAHSKCNLKCCKPKFIPVIFHNLSGYDAHLFVKNVGVSREGKIDCIPQNEEKYISFTKEIVVDTYRDKLSGKEKPITRELRFIDSYKFMSPSLDSLVSNLGKGDFKSVSSGEQSELLLRKGVYPYEYMESIEKLKETKLPPKEAFFSKLTGENVSQEDYEHAKRVWKTFGCKTLRDYHNLYNRSDVLQLCDVFENFRDVCMKNYNLDPAWYYTAPGLAWDALLKITGGKLKLFTDPNMLLIIERGIRGGISMISNRYSKANNIYMGEDYDETDVSKYIAYLDANNLYGWAMCKKMPTHGFPMDE